MGVKFGGGPVSAVAPLYQQSCLVYSHLRQPPGLSLSFGLTCSKRPQKPCTWRDGEKVRAGSQLGAQGLLGLSPPFGSQKVLDSGSGPLPMVFVGERVTLPFLEPQFPHL